MNLAYFDCYAGASGDMILGALVDAGLDVDALRHLLAALALPNWELRAEKITTHGLAATRVHVVVQDDAPARRYVELDAMLNAGRLDHEIKETSARILRRIAEVEARLHHTEIENVHLHELGGMDTLIDIVGAVAGLKLLAVAEVYVSALPMGHGEVKTRHGKIPLPAPAVLELARGAPVRAVDVNAELVTPTGAAILTTLARGYASFLPMTLSGVGYGAGMRELPFANVLRVFIGSAAQADDAKIETLVMLETNIDDMNPQLFEYVFAKLFDAGALDVWMTPIQMKKNRGAASLSVLCSPRDVAALKEILFMETTTLGVREREVKRHALARAIVSVNTPFGEVRVKLAKRHGRAVRATPEYEDCRRVAEKNKVPLLEIYRAAETSSQPLLNDLK